MQNCECWTESCALPPFSTFRECVENLETCSIRLDAKEFPLAKPSAMSSFCLIRIVQDPNKMEWAKNGSVLPGNHGRQGRVSLVMCAFNSCECVYTCMYMHTLSEKRGSRCFSPSRKMLAKIGVTLL